MTQPRYELLSSDSKQDDVNQSGLSRRTTFGSHYDEEDDENEEIELGTEHRIRYESDEEEEDCYINGHLAGKTVTRDNVHNESGGVAGSPTTALLPGSRLLQMAVGTIMIILLYLVLSIGLTFYQQKLIKVCVESNVLKHQFILYSHYILGTTISHDHRCLPFSIEIFTFCYSTNNL